MQTPFSTDDWIAAAVRSLLQRDGPANGERRPPVIVELRERFELDANTAISAIRQANDERAKCSGRQAVS